MKQGNQFTAERTRMAVEEEKRRLINEACGDVYAQNVTLASGAAHAGVMTHICMSLRSHRDVHRCHCGYEWKSW